MVHHLNRLLDDGEIEVVDVDTKDTIILHVRYTTGCTVLDMLAGEVSTASFYALDFRAAEFLIHCGADVHDERIYGQ